MNQNKVLKNARRKLLDAASSFGVLDLALAQGASKKSAEHKDDFVDLTIWPIALLSRSEEYKQKILREGMTAVGRESLKASMLPELHGQTSNMQSTRAHSTG